ncbi:MAG: MFS transporter [Pleurocapsa sp. SU_196_0]|nr:MFS transporter [Pleurocapsa sp. SU_196_0]
MPRWCAPIATSACSGLDRSSACWGDWFNLIASAALVAELTQSGLAVGSLFVVRTLAPFLLSPIAGVVADRYDRKWILILSDLSRSAVVFCFLLVRDPGDVWLLYALTALQLGLSAFYFPARNAMLPDVVTPAELGAANALSSATWSVMLAVGAALGGLVAGAWGSYTAFVVDGSTFILSASLTLLVTLAAKPANSGNKSVGAALREYMEGVRYLNQHRDTLLITCQKAINALFLSSSFQVLQVAIAQQIFTVGEGGGISLGLMFGLAGIGTGIGPMFARYITGDDNRRLRWGIAAGYLIGGLGLVISAPLFNFGTFLLGTLIRGIGGGIIWVFATQLLMQVVPGPVRGRIFATEFAFFYLGSALGATVIGALLDAQASISAIIGGMAVFDRSWYGRVLVERIEKFCDEDDWMRAYSEINDFEEMLARRNILLLKFWIHISPEEQLRRFKAREKVSFKKYKITDEDWRNRDKNRLYDKAAEEIKSKGAKAMIRSQIATLGTYVLIVVPGTSNQGGVRGGFGGVLPHRLPGSQQQFGTVRRDALFETRVDRR